MKPIDVLDRLHSQLHICEIHRKRILWSLSKIRPNLPMTEQNYAQLDDAQVEHWDQLIWRFTKLQDLLGEKVFRSYLSLLQEPVVSSPFIDQLSRLEQLRILNSAEDWQELRQARNSSAHEYAESEAEGASILNRIVALVDLLLMILDRLQQQVSAFRI